MMLMKEINSKKWLIFLVLGLLLLATVNDSFVSYSNVIAGFSGIALIMLALIEWNDSKKKR